MYVLRITKEIRDEALFEKQVLCKIPLSVKVLVKCIMIVTAYILFGILLIPVTRNYLIEHRGRDYYVNRYLEENHSINYIYGELFILSNNINIIKNNAPYKPIKLFAYLYQLEKKMPIIVVTT